MRIFYIFHSSIIYRLDNKNLQAKSSLYLQTPIYALDICIIYLLCSYFVFVDLKRNIQK